MQPKIQMSALQQLRLFLPLQPDFEGGKRGPKTVSAHMRGQLEKGNSQKMECNTEYIDTGVKKPNELYSNS